MLLNYSFKRIVVLRMLIEDVAKRLDVTARRVQALAQSGEIPARRQGSMWVFETEDVEEYRRRRKVGRPVSGRLGWEILAQLSGMDALSDDRMVAHRARLRIREGEVLPVLRNANRVREQHRWRVLDSDLPRMARSGVVTGEAGADKFWFDVVGRGLSKLYVTEGEVRGLRGSYHPIEGGTANVVLLVPSQDWVLTRKVVAPQPVVAADLLLDPDSRVRRAAERYLGSLVNQWRG